MRSTISKGETETMKNFKNLIYILACMSYTVVIGAATYEHLAVWPRAFAAPPASLTMFQGDYGLNPAAFWTKIHTVLLVLLIIALIAHWRTSRRRSIVVTFAIYAVLMVATAVYFVPELVAITGTDFATTVDPDLVARGQKWQMLSWFRQVVLMAAAGVLFHGLTKNAESQS